MDYAQVPLWQWVATVWSATWVLVLIRTWGKILYGLDLYYPKIPITAQPFLHFFVYAITINLLIVVIGIPIVLSDNIRDKWVHSYVHSIAKKENTKNK